MQRSDLDRAKTRLAEGAYTCALAKGEQELTSQERGVKPLLTWLTAEENLQGFSAADKVVGKAAAFLYVLLGVREIYAPVMSRPAKEVLEAHGISVHCDTLTEAIRNRTNTGFCPMETAVWEITDPMEALAAIRQKAKELNG